MCETTTSLHRFPCTGVDLYTLSPLVLPHWTQSWRGGSIYLVVYGRLTGQPLLVTLAVTEVGSYLDLDGEGARGYENLGNGKLRVTVPVDLAFETVFIPLLENDVREADGSVTITIEPDTGGSYIPSATFGTLTIPVKDNDTPSTVSISAADDLTEGAQLSYTLTRTWAPGQIRGELSVNVELAQTGDYITWPTAHQPDADGLVTIPVNFAARSLTATLTLETVDDQMSEDNGSVTATILADAGGRYMTGADSGHTTRLLDNDLPVISVAAVSAEVTEGTDAQFRFNRMGNTSGATRVGLWVGGLPKIMTDATEAIALTADNADLSQRLHIHGAWVDYILEFAAGEAEKTLSFTTEADNVNEGDGWLGVTIVQRAGNPFGIGTGYAQVHIHDDDVPTVTISQVTLPTGAATLEGDTWVGELGEVQPLSWVVSCSGNYEYSPLLYNPSVSGLPVQVENIRLANHPAFYGGGTGWELGRNILGYVSGGICDGQAQTSANKYRVVGPDGGVETFKLVPKDRAPSIVAEYRERYRQAKAAADAAGTLVTQHDIIHEHAVRLPHTLLINCHDEPRYCPQYRVGTPHKIRLTLVNRDPTILIKAESTTVEEGQAARFIVERLWHDDLLRGIVPDSETVVALRASQNGQYITGVLPTEITFGQNETSKTIELATVDDAAFGENGSVTIELLPDTTGADLNIAGKYETFEHWAGHTPEGARSDRATIAITNNDTKPGITIAPASAPEGDTGSADMTFTVTLAKAVTEAVTVNYATSDGTAIAGQDYTAVSNGSVTIAAGTTTAEFTVSVTGDETDELDETFTVTISMPDPEPNLNGGSSGEPMAAIIGGDTATVTGTIRDDDPAVVTVAPKVDTVEEGEAAVFVLTRAGMTNGRLAMQVRLRSPGRLQMLDARFEPGAVTTEIAVATHNNNLVDYPSVRDYTIEVFGDGAPLDQDDRVFTPGAPASATVKVTDDDKLINVTVSPVKALLTGGNPYFEFSRDGDTSQPLTIEYAYFLHTPGDNTVFTYWATATFEAGQDEVVVQHDYIFEEGVEYGPEYDSLLPLSLTYVVFGDGGWHGLNRIYQGGDPNAATVTMSYNGHDHALTLGAEAPFRVSVGQTVSIPLTVTNTGTLVTRTPITITATHKSDDPAVDGANEPRMSCRIAGPIAAGESAVCEVSFLVQEKDLNPANYAEIELDVTASDGRTTSNAFRIFMSVLNGISVGFNEAANLRVTEPGFGEANAKANLTVTRVGRSAEEVQVAYTLEPWPTGFRSYSPVEGVDYADNSATPGVITFAENETVKTITIDILGDQIDEAKEQFLVTLVPPQGVLVEEHKRTRIVVINDTSPPAGESYQPTASLHLVSSGPVPESEGPVEFAIVLDREWGIDGRYEVEVLPDQLTATPGIARSGKKGDFEDPGVLVVRIPAGQTRFEFSIPLYDDDVREEDETFQLLLGSSIDKSFRTIGPSNKVLATIADDDRIPSTGVELSLSHKSRAMASVPEGSNRRKITVTASFAQVHWPGDAANAPLHPADPRDVDTTVRVQVDPNSGATHPAGLDDFEPLRMEDDLDEFQVVESFDIVIPAGQTSGNATVGFWPVKDDVDEEDETVTLQGSEVVAGGSEDSLPVRSASFTIIDDDTRGITTSPAIALLTLVLVEGGEPGTYSLVLDSQPTDTVVITLAGNQGGFLNLVPDTLTFTTSNWDTPQMVSVMALDDGIAGGVPPTNFVTHQVSGGDYGSVTVPDISTLIEDTTKAFVYLEGGQASESDGYVEFTVTVRPVLRTTPVLVRYATVDGTAIAGSDYTREMETGQTYKILNIPAGQSSATIRIPITDDQVYESADETFTLQLTNHNNKAALDGSATSLTATGAIADDDPKPVVSVAGPAGEVSYVSENAKDPVTFTLTLVGQSAGDVTVDYATGEPGLLDLLTARQGLAGATENEDYAGTSGTVTFTPGQTTKTVTVQVTNDDVSEDTEFFGFTISMPQGADLRGQRSEDVADVGLVDDDPRGVTIAPTSIGLNEPASGETAVAGAYTVKLSSSPTDTVTVTTGGSDPAVSLSGDTLTSNQLTFTTTNWNTAQTITVTPVKDDNAAGETVTLTHTLSGGDYTGIAADSVTINLTDSDTRNVVLSRQSLAVTEGDATGVGYTVKLATQPSDTVTVAISGHDGANLTLSGTRLTNNQLTFTTTNWGTAQTVTVKAGDDDNTDNESETLAHTASGGDYVNITKDLPVSITDDGDPQVTVSFGQGAYTVAEGESQAVTVTLSADPERTVEIPITVTPQDGAVPADYSVMPASVTFARGEPEMTITFTATQDADDDDNESALLAFGELPDGVSAGTTNEATVSITDDDTPPTAANGTVTTNEDTAHTFAAANFSYSDTDNDPLVSVKIIELPAAGTGALTLNGTAITSTNLPKTVTAAELTENKLTYSPPTNAHGTGYASFKFKVNDGTLDSAEYIMTINVTPVNDPATGIPTISGIAQVGQTLTASTGDIADPDGLPSAFTYQWKRYAADRTTFEANIGTDSMTYTLTASEEGKKVLVEVRFTDNDGSSEGPLVSALYPSTQSQTVDPNNPPTASDGTVTTVEDTAHSFAPANFSYSDTDSDPLVSVKIIELPATGALTLNGTAITSADLPKTVTAAELTENKLTYSPPTNANGAGYASYKFKVNDGTEDSASEYFMTINVTAVNDPATGTPTISGTAHAGLTLTASTAGIDDVDGLPSAFTYQWKRVDADGTSNPTDIGADSSTYTLTAAEEGKKVLVEVSFTDNGGSSEGPLASAAHPSSGTVQRITVSFAQATYAVLEDAEQLVTVTLNTDPERTVVIPLTATPQDGAESPADYTVPPSVTFDAGQMSQTITFTATQDDVDDDGERVLLGFGMTLPGGVSLGTTVTTTVSITDDDDAGVSVSEASLTIAEGSSGTYTIVLDSQPTAGVTVTINDPSNTDVTAEPASLTFSSTDWSSPKTVTVNAAQDADAEDETATVTHTVTSTDSIYSGAPANSVAVSVTDDEVPVTVQFGATTYEVVEGETVTVAVTLNADPERTVVIPLTATPQDGAESPADYTVPPSVTFDAGQMSQTITFTATQDDVGDDGERVLLGFGMTLPGGVSLGTTVTTTVSITDDDDAGVSVSEASLTIAEGSSGTYTLVLGSRPTGDVTIGVTLPTGTDLTLDKTTLTFTVDNWDVAQTVAVTAAEDDDGVTDAGVTLTHTVSGGSYESTTVPDVEVSITENDTAGLVLSETGLTVTEGDAAGSSYTVKLATEPMGSVSVAITGHDGTDLSLDKTTLTFTVDNWNTAQTVTVKAGQDGDGANDTATLTHTASGGDYASVSNTLPVTITDDDEAGGDDRADGAERCGGPEQRVHRQAGHPAHGRRDRDHLRPCKHGCDAGQDDADLHLDQLGRCSDGQRLSYSERRHSEGYSGACRCGCGLRFRHRGAGGRLGGGCCRSAADPSGRGELIGADPDGA